MYVSATPRYEASSLSPLSKRAGRDRGSRQEQSGQHEASDTSDESQPPITEPDEFADVAFDLPDEALGYSNVLTETPVDGVAQSPPVSVAAPPAPKDSLFDLLDRVVAEG